MSEALPPLFETRERLLSLNNGLVRESPILSKLIDLDRLQESYGVFHRRTGLQITIETHLLILNILIAMVLDPHPDWKSEGQFASVRENSAAGNFEPLQGPINSYIARLPEVLTTIAEEEAVREGITAFDFLHGLTSRLDAMCIFNKPPKSRPRRS